ncbi:hypothetical protein AMS68_004111 [Peltaster fructicola]|uniref:Amino acid permease/ SLC12A domain-containing protein n=1 Tax=Peltaster fructicola TaxID=286661 RepID=A0A6H0XV32_9PEZI|nr:hypothetical protein AMS68_004111 [Peltaster fructicola]
MKHDMRDTTQNTISITVQGSNDVPEYQNLMYSDEQDMQRLGKKQELHRSFSFTSILGFVAIAMGTWEIILSATAAGLTNGGTGGMIWMFVASYCCFGTIVLSLAEMSSMAPTAGGQYRGWPSTGLSMLVGQVTAIYGLIGSDGAAHMAEETKNASILVPRCMIWSYILNGSMGIVMLITYCYCLTDVSSALDPTTNPSGFPYIYVFRSVTGSDAGAIGLTSIILVLGLAGATSFFASTSRQTFAFARDRGLPAFKWIAAVQGRSKLPLNAILVTYAFTVLLSLINLGSTIAFNAIISLQLLALMATYAVSIGCILLRRIRRETLPPARWSLGRYGLLINAFAFFYSLFAIIFICFPVSLPVEAASMNWAIVMFVGVLSIALVYYYVHGHRVYHGPVVLVQTLGS